MEICVAEPILTEKKTENALWDNDIHNILDGWEKISSFSYLLN